LALRHSLFLAGVSQKVRVWDACNFRDSFLSYHHSAIAKIKRFAQEVENLLRLRRPLKWATRKMFVESEPGLCATCYDKTCHSAGYLSFVGEHQDVIDVGNNAVIDSATPSANDRDVGNTPGARLRHCRCRSKSHWENGHAANSSVGQMDAKIGSHSWI
jgi:hypothetical protein